MTRFDAPESSPSRWVRHRATVVAMVLGNPGVVAATWFITSLVLFAATALVALAIGVPAALREGFTASPTLVFAAPAASRADVEALGARLRALPMVADATLRPKDVALAALVQAGLPAVADVKNPLPDVWIVRLRLDETGRARPNFVTAAVSARDAIAALASVDRVRFDDGWMSFLDRAGTRWSAFGTPAIAVGLIMAALAIHGIQGLFARAVRVESEAGKHKSKSALAIVDGLVVATAGLLVYGVWSVVASTLTGVDVPTLKPIVDELGRSSAVIVGTACLVAVLVGWLGVVFFERPNSLTR